MTGIFAQILTSVTRRTAILAALFLLSAVSIFAVPLDNYRSDIARAVVLLDSLQQPDADATLNQITQNERAVLNEVRRLVPAKQKIEFGANSLEADNNWLEKDLQRFEEMKLADEKRGKFLQQTVEKLGAIRDRLDALIAAEIAAPGKNDNKQKLDQILQRPEFKKPEEREKSVLERWMESLEKWLQEMFRPNEPTIAPSTAPNLSALGSILSYVVIGVAILIIAFVVYRFLLPLMERDRRLKITKTKEARIVLGEKIRADESAADLLAEAENLARAGDVRAAIRKGYIALLCDLADRKLLGLARHKTNRDYLRDLKQRPEIFQNVREVTGSFERHWYGRVSASEEDWQTFRVNYEQAVKQK